ncbi:nucleotidyltransferase [Ahrensia kielensis]|uniref:Nucleotidyltransferase n=1 Tax=Ahrensia kielensis TaxID=76980 RepID=A0ABU9T6T8_9HYPH
MPPTMNLDDLLLDVATSIEPSDADRKIIDKRYRELKTHLERPNSALSEFLKNDKSRIYPQGSISISATILSGEKDDRFDVDAMVEFDVPPNWSNRKPLDVLFEALQGFPGAQKIVRNTRCVTIHFAFMHMDVTIMDPESEPRTERVGEIFHSPDTGESDRIPANPYGFAYWFRKSVHFQEGVGSFAERVANRRIENSIDRLELSSPRAADQDDLPATIPPRFDAQQVVALKLIKRAFIVAYRNRGIKRPPSIYVTKKASDCGFEPLGLTSQVQRLAICLRDEMDKAIELVNGPDERNPTHIPDRINDRWPKHQMDRQTLRTVADEVTNCLEKAKSMSFTEVAKILSELFGENISGQAVEKHLQRREGSNASTSVVKGVGTVIPSAILTAPGLAKETRIVPDHHFHCENSNENEKDH